MRPTRRQLETQLAEAHALLRELQHHDERKYGQWTGGMRERVAIALGQDGAEARKARPIGRPESYGV